MFQKMKIATKLIWGFGVVLVCLVIVIAVSGLSLRNISGGFANLLTREGGIKVLTLNAGASMRECRNNEKDFEIQKDLQYVDKFEQNFTGFEKQMGEIVSLANQSGHEDIAQGAQNVLAKGKEYQKAFLSLVEAEKNEGLDLESGLQGAFREQARIVQDAMRKHAVDDLRAAYLYLRLCEKDYHRTLADRDQETWDKAIADYKTLLGTSNADKETIDAQLKALESYEKAREEYLLTVVDYGPGLMLDSSYESMNRRPVRKMEAAIAAAYVPRAEALILEVRRSEKDYLLRGDEKYAEQVHQGMDKLVAAMQASQVSEEMVTRMTGTIQQYLKAFDALVAEEKNIQGLEQAADESMNAIAPLLDNMDRQVGQTIEQVTQNTVAYTKSQSLIGLGVGLVAVLAGIIAAFLITSSIRRPIARTVEFAKAIREGDLSKRMRLNIDNEVGQLSSALDDMADSIEASQLEIERNLTELQELVQNVTQVSHQVTSGANQVADASQTLSQGATEQASSLEEISASMNEIRSQTQTNAENAQQASQLATTAKDSGERGSQQVLALESAMTDIEIASQDISRIIKTIDDIAFQTNLLALNAAVEAARAGVHGKGFAVVAQEVRTLAARSAKAAEETSGLIEDSGAKIRHGNDVAKRTVTILNEIILGVGQVSDLVDEIAASSNEQAQGIAQINQGLTQIDSVTQQNTANAEETAAAAQTLSSQAGTLRQTLVEFASRKSYVEDDAEEDLDSASGLEQPAPVKALPWGD